MVGIGALKRQPWRSIPVPVYWLILGTVALWGLLILLRGAGSAQFDPGGSLRLARVLPKSEAECGYHLKSRNA